MSELTITDIELTEVTPETVVAELTEAVFGTDTQVTAYKVANVINGAFKVLEIEKVIPTQMMYNYTKNGLISKGKKGKASEIRYTKDEVKTFATKYVNKYVK